MIEAFILGIIGGAMPGPVLATTFTEILQSGFLKSLRIVFFAVFIETTIAIFSLVALSSFNLSQSFFKALSVIGAGVLVWVAISIWKIRQIDTDQKVHFGFGKIAAMILNGAIWAYWTMVCAPKAIQMGKDFFMGQYLFVVIVEIGWLVATITIALIFSNFMKLLSNPRIVPIIFKVFSIILIFFAASMVYDSFRFFLIC